MYNLCVKRYVRTVRKCKYVRTWVKRYVRGSTYVSETVSTCDASPPVRDSTHVRTIRHLLGLQEVYVRTYVRMVRTYVYFLKPEAKLQILIRTYVRTYVRN